MSKTAPSVKSSKPIVEVHNDIFVVRDDLYPGGTKARYIPQLIEGHEEVVYATPAEGGAQFALATVCREIGVRLTLFVAKRAHPHPRALQAKSLGAKIIQVDPGYLTVVQKRALEYCNATGAHLLQFGLRSAIAARVIAEAARAIDVDPTEVWCAAGSGTLARALSLAWPKAERHAVGVGRAIEYADVMTAHIHAAPIPFGKRESRLPPFPADPHYDAKAWFFCRDSSKRRPTLFWNVAPPAPLPNGANRSKRAETRR